MHDLLMELHSACMCKDLQEKAEVSQGTDEVMRYSPLSTYHICWMTIGLKLHKALCIKQWCTHICCNHTHGLFSEQLRLLCYDPWSLTFVYGSKGRICSMQHCWHLHKMDTFFLTAHARTCPNKRYSTLLQHKATAFSPLIRRCFSGIISNHSSSPIQSFF